MPQGPEIQHEKSEKAVMSTYHSEVLEWPSSLNVLEGLAEVLEFHGDLVLGSLGVLYRLNLEGLDSLDLPVDIVGGGLEGLESLLNLVDDGLVLQGGAVLGEVDLGGLLLEELELAASIFVSLLKGLEGGHRLAAEAEGGGDLDPVELERCASLREAGKKISSYSPTKCRFDENHSALCRLPRANWSPVGAKKKGAPRPPTP